jgi:hypothetical protein
MVMRLALPAGRFRSSASQRSTSRAGFWHSFR